MTPINHPSWFPLRGPKPGFIPSFPTEHQQVVELPALFLKTRLGTLACLGGAESGPEMSRAPLTGLSTDSICPVGVSVLSVIPLFEPLKESQWKATHLGAAHPGLKVALCPPPPLARAGA